MPKPAVVDGAVLKCIAGSAPSNLTVTTDPFTQIERHLAATVFDNQPGVNVKPFGACLILGGPCFPVTPAPWTPGATSIQLASPFPLLPADSLLMCAVGGIIQVVSPGQSSVFVDTMTTPGAAALVAELAGLDNVLDFLSNIGPFMTLIGLKMKINKILVSGALMNEARALRVKLRNPSLSARQRAALIKRARLLQNLSEGSDKVKGLRAAKALKLLRGLGAVGDVVDVASLALNLKKGNLGGARRNAVSLAATTVCAIALSETVVGVAACTAAGPAVNYLIDHRRAIAHGGVVVLTHTPGVMAGKWVVRHRDDIARAGKRAVGTVRDVAGDAAGKAKDVAGKAKNVAGGVASGVGGALKKIPKPPVPHLHFP
jgi:hypothetical protein